MADQRIRLDEIVDGQSIKVDPITGRLVSTPISVTGTGSLAPIVNVTESPHNAKGNGVADDTAAIASAVAACASGGVVRFPVPSVGYKLSGEILLTRNVSLVGDYGLIPIIQSNAGADVIHINCAVAPAGMHIRHFIITGGRRGVWIDGAGIYRGSCLRNLEIAGCSDAGIYIDGDTVIGCKFQDWNIYGCDYGMYAIGQQNLNGAQFDNARFALNRRGVRIDPAGNVQGNVRFFQPIFEANTETAFSTDNSSVFLAGAWFENNGSAGGTPGHDAIYPDISVGFQSSTVMSGGLMSSASPQQSLVRVRFDDANGAYVSRDVQWISGIIDGNNQGGTVEVYGKLKPASIINGASISQMGLDVLHVQLGTAGIYTGAGDPEGVQAAAKGSLYLRTGSSAALYVKQAGSGNTSWVRFDLFVAALFGDGSVFIQMGAGSPEGAITAGVGSRWYQTDAPGYAWRKASGTGNTGWVRDNEFQNVLFVDTIASGPRIVSGTADPSAGAGVVAALGSSYHRANGAAGEFWVKTGAGNTAWTKVI